MISVVIPLAGPDAYSEEHGLRPFARVGNSTLIEAVMARRPWRDDIERAEAELIFVLREEKRRAIECRDRLAALWPAAKFATVSALTRGALFSALAGASLRSRPEDPLIIDLADILFNADIDVASAFAVNRDLKALVPVFESENEKFSYLELDGARVLRAREKQVISGDASAGVYIFRDSAAFLSAAAWAVDNPAVGAVNGAFFVCPSINGLIAHGARIEAVRVRNAEPVSLRFH